MSRAPCRVGDDAEQIAAAHEAMRAWPGNILKHSNWGARLFKCSLQDIAVVVLGANQVDSAGWACSHETCKGSQGVVG